jgi:hypothetical protein
MVTRVEGILQGQEGCQEAKKEGQETRERDVKGKKGDRETIKGG